MTVAPSHPRTLTSWLARHPRRSSLLPILLYVLLVISAAWLRRTQINPDGICYIRLATYLLRHDWSHAVSGYWSPLFSWCMTPLLSTGINGLTAAHVTLAIIGAVYLLAADYFLKQFPRITPAIRWWLMIITAAVTVRLAVRIITPDLLMAALLLFYLALTQRPDLLHRRRIPFIAGCVGGLAYLAKAYALPFVLIHFPLTLLLRRWGGADPQISGDIAPSRPATPRYFISLLAALLGCLLVSAPWIAVLSHSYGRLTITTAGSFNHNEVQGAPDEVRYRFRFFIPPDPYLLESEIIDRQVHQFWSPFDSWKRFGQQWQIIRHNTPEILRTLGGFDQLWLVPLSLAISLILALRLLLRRLPRRRVALIAVDGRSGIAARGSEEPSPDDTKPKSTFAINDATSQNTWTVVWLATSLLIYCAGFTLVYFESRLISVALRLPAMLLCVLVALSVSDLLKLHRGVLPKFVLLVLGVASLIDLAGAYHVAKADRLPHQVAQAMRAENLTGPLISSNRGFGGYVAYFLNAKLITLPADASPSELQRYCEQANVRYALILGKPAPSRAAPSFPSTSTMRFIQSPNWTHRLQINGTEETVDVFERTQN